MNLSRDRRHESDDPDAYQIKIDGRAADALKRLKVPPRYLSPILCGSVVVVVLVAFLVGLVIPESGKDAGPLNVNLLVVGDWGRQGNYNQTDTAVRMASVSLSLNPSPLAVLSTGDNFYGNPDRLGGGGLFSTDDDNFYRSFKSVYARPGLMMPWYTILGNHDYGEKEKGGRGSARGSLAKKHFYISRRMIMSLTCIYIYIYIFSSSDGHPL